MIDENLVEHLAQLAKLDVTMEEKAKYGEQLSAILDYVKKLQSVDLMEITPTDHITGLKNISRDDEPANAFSVKKTMKAVPEISLNQIKVKPVLSRKK